MPERPLERVDELRSYTADAWALLGRMGELLGDGSAGGILATLHERLLALTGEFAWELGMVHPQDAGAGQHGARLDHVGIVVADLRAAAELYGDALGGTLVSGGVHEGMGIRSLHFTFHGGSKVELLEPVRPGAVADFLAARGGGLHHLTYFVPKLTDTLDDLDGRGMRVVDVSLADPSWQEAYLGPRSTQGCVLQLVTAPDLERADGITLEAVLADEWHWIDHRAAHRPAGEKE